MIMPMCSAQKLLDHSVSCVANARFGAGCMTSPYSHNRFLSSPYLQSPSFGTDVREVFDDAAMKMKAVTENGENHEAGGSNIRGNWLDVFCGGTGCCKHFVCEHGCGRGNPGKWEGVVGNIYALFFGKLFLNGLQERFMARLEDSCAALFGMQCRWKCDVGE